LIGIQEVTPFVIRPHRGNAFNHRMYRMMKKWEISYRRKTTIAKIPQNTRHNEEVQTQFVKYVQFKKRLLDISNEDTFNVDQTNLPFSMESTYTWAKRNSRSVPIRSASSNQRATVMLGCNATGTIMLPPFMVFKGSTAQTGRIYQELRQSDGYPDGVELTVQEKVWFDESIMLQWIQVVWRPMMEKRNMRKTYLLLDEFGVHTTASVIEAFSKLNTDIEMIPAGNTAVLQAMDVGINKPFKDYVRRSYNVWCKRQTTETAKPHRRDAAYWCLGAWNKIKASTVTNTWNSIGYVEVITDTSNESIDESVFGFDMDTQMESMEEVPIQDPINEPTLEETVTDSSETLVDVPMENDEMGENIEVDSVSTVNTQYEYSEEEVEDDDPIVESESSDDSDSDDDNLHYLNFFIANLDRSKVSNTGDTEVAYTTPNKTSDMSNGNDEEESSA
jgi:DDE superfamily endonuclease